ncbi:MAG: glycosyltransferase, partial [Synergistaceae bacterium]|nr:glycosyltransferase [Synergistaceae bacterium]
MGSQNPHRVDKTDSVLCRRQTYRRKMKNQYRKYKPDIIHLHSSKAGILGRIVFPKNKIIYTVHGFDSIRLAYR